MRRDDADQPPHHPATPPERSDGTGSPGPDDVVPRIKAEQDQMAALRRTRQRRLAKVGAVLAIVIVLVIFVISNSQPVKVEFVVMTRHPRLIWVMLACAILGGVAGYLIGKPGKQVHVRHRDRTHGDRPASS